MRMRPHYLRTVRKHIYGRKERQNRFLPRSQGVSKVCQLSGCPWFCSASSSICSHSGTAVSASCERVYTFGPDGPSRIHSDHLSRGGDSRNETSDENRGRMKRFSA